MITFVYQFQDLNFMIKDCILVQDAAEEQIVQTVEHDAYGTG